MDDLEEGNAILATTKDGTLTSGVVSLISIAKPEVEATFLRLTTDAGDVLTLTPEHHLPIGETCCSLLKKAKDVAVGELVWRLSAEGGVATKAKVTEVALAIDRGLHSPVLTNGAYPIVDGVVTSFDSTFGVTLAHVGLEYLEMLLKATGTGALFRATLAGYKKVGSMSEVAVPTVLPPTAHMATSA